MPPGDRKAAYERLRAAHLSAVRAALEDHVARLAWPRDRIERYQTERLRSLLGFARERSPFHAARMADVDPATATVDDLARLPVMVKQEAQYDWDRIVTAPGIDRIGAERVLAEQRWFSYTPAGHQVFSSGGSSGVRGVYVWDWEQFVTLACLAWRWQVRAERASGSAQRPVQLAVLEAGEPPHASTPLFDIATGPSTATVVIPAAAPFDRVLQAVAEARPTHLVGYASVIGALARAAIGGALDIRPVRVSTNSEPLADEDREAIDTAWGAPVHNLWGSTEIGVQAVGCGHGDGLHVCEDEVILERVDPAGRPVGPDEPAARTLATGLAGRTFPFIRYDLGDEVTLLPGRCACGSAMVRVADIAGRRDDDFRYGRRTVPASAFRHVLGTDPLISEYQVHQTAAGADVLVVGVPDVSAVAAALVSSLRPYGLSQPEINVRVVGRIPRHAATGKLKRFVPLSGPLTAPRTR
ncbi:phenylacetate--CoA ligase family protein [Saccharomonospora sp. NPDC046836]|uniref:phenylacetate--CoA ligase family protein n=1 Tax=Saccharomonospora sp. NPDC046836 TaxID=3156921 RepID=UPI0034013B77